MTETPTIGDNRGPLITEDELARDHAEVAKQIADLVERAKALPETVDSEEVSETFGQFIIAAKAGLKGANETRETAKESFLAAGRTVDGFFNAGMRDKLQPYVANIERANNLFLKAQADKRRAAADAEALRLKKEADEMAAAAAAAESEGRLRVADVEMAAAVQTDKEALKAEKVAGQSDLDLSRTHMAGGGSASVNVIEVVTGFDRATVDLNALRPYLAEAEIERALKAALKVKVRVAGATYGEDIRGNYGG